MHKEALCGTHGDNVNQLVGDDGLSTSVVLQLQGSDHVKGVLRSLGQHPV
jgi:hypothetical protein